jgi:hypothetical protein
MKLPGFKRLYTQDFPEESKGLIDQLSFFFNNGVEVLYSALNNNITLSENIAGKLAEFDVKLSSGIPNITTSFAIDNTRKVIGLEILKVDNNTNSNTFPSSGVFITWDQNNNTVLIKHITGLNNTDSYTIRVYAYYQN